jgi:hypothetical protein
VSGTTRPVATWEGRRRLAAKRSTFGAPVDRRAGQAPFFPVLASWLLGRAKFGCLQRQKPAMFTQMPLFVYRHFTGAVCTTSSDGRFALFSAPSTAAFSLASGLSNSSDILLFRHLQSPPLPWVACCAHQVQNFDLSQTFWCRGLWSLGFNEQIFGADKQVPGHERSDKRSVRLYAMMQGGKGRTPRFLRNPLCQLAPSSLAPQPEDGASSSDAAMTSANSFSLILRRLDEIERKLDHVLEELRTPAAIGYSVRRPKNDPPRVIDDGCKQEVFGPTRECRVGRAELPSPALLNLPRPSMAGAFSIGRCRV